MLANEHQGEDLQFEFKAPLGLGFRVLGCPYWGGAPKGVGNLVIPIIPLYSLSFPKVPQRSLVPSPLVPPPPLGSYSRFCSGFRAQRKGFKGLGFVFFLGLGFKGLGFIGFRVQGLG